MVTCGVAPPFDLDAERVHYPACILSRGHDDPHHFRSQRSDRPFEEVTSKVERILAQDPSVAAFQKWTCRHCGSRETMTVPNRFDRSGSCEECGGETDIVANGCNYMLFPDNRRAQSGDLTR